MTQSKSETTLTFKNGQFVLRNPSKKQKYNYRQEWEKTGTPRTYRTTSLKAAAEFKSHSDKRAERVFRRAFVSFYDLPFLPPLEFLDPHQREGVRWVLTRSRSYLAHAPGAGKTAQVIIASCLISTIGQTLFIVPPSLTKNWEREILKFTERLDTTPTIATVPSTAKQGQMDWGADFIICPDSMVTKTWVYARLQRLRLKLLAVDEASRFKEPTSNRSLALYGGRTKTAIYYGLYQDARHVVFLDGSPMPNRPMELWAPTYALNPESIDLMDQKDFGFRYCGPRLSRFTGAFEFNGASNQEELHEKLCANFMHVVSEAELNHPERKRSLLFMSRDPRSPELKTWEQKHLKTLDLSRLSESQSKGDLAHLRRELGLAKVPWIAQYVKERLDVKSESILLFVWHREVALGLAALLSKHNPGVVIGGTSEDKREAYFKDFQAGKRRLLICNIGAAGRGHNLQKADRVIFAECSWSDELNKQCEKRASRRGRAQKASVRCEYVVAPDSLDEKVLNSVFTKSKNVRRVIG